MEGWRVEGNVNAKYKAGQEKRRKESSKVERQKKERDRGETDRRQGRNIKECLFLQFVCVCVCVNIRHTSIFITLSDTQRFFFFSPTSGFRVALCLCYRTVPVQRSSSHHISLLTTSQKNTTRPVRKLGEKETHGRKHSVNARKGR